MNVVAPYESPIEQIFAEVCGKYLAKGTRLQAQVKEFTSVGHFRVDFLLTRRDRVVAVECDGAAFHKVSEDERRDAILLSETRLDVIYRLRGQDLTYLPEDAVWALSIEEPALFSQRGVLNLSRLHRLDVEPRRLGSEGLVLSCSAESRLRLCAAVDSCTRRSFAPCRVSVTKRVRTQ